MSWSSGSPVGLSLCELPDPPSSAVSMESPVEVLTKICFRLRADELALPVLDGELLLAIDVSVGNAFGIGTKLVPSVANALAS